MARRRKSKKGGLLTPVALLLALLAFANPKIFEVFTFYGIIILVVSAVIFVAYKLLRKQRQAVPSMSMSTPSITTPTRTSPPAMDALDREFERRHSLPTEEAKPTAWSAGLIRELEWKRFEDLCADYFKAKGHRAEVTKHGADGGIDILLYAPSNPDKVLGIIQCKSWKDRVVGVGPIRELFGVMTDAGSPLGIFVTIAGYSREAEAFAEGKHIKLLDAQKLLEMIRSLPAQQQRELLDSATSGDYKTPSCPSCGIKLVLRTAGKGSNKGSHFWGCRNYPRCRYTMRANSVS